MNMQTISRIRMDLYKLSGVKGRQVCSKGVITNLLPFNSWNAAFVESTNC